MGYPHNYQISSRAQALPLKAAAGARQSWERRGRSRLARSRPTASGGSTGSLGASTKTTPGQCLHLCVHASAFAGFGLDRGPQLPLPTTMADPEVEMS
jgi:hypothetical protein